MRSAAPVNDNAQGAIDRGWVAEAMAFLNAERSRAADMPIFKLECPELAGIDILIKDETGHPTGSLKHRLAHALFSHAICNGDIGPDTTVVEASSGSTAISEAWFADRLGLRFVAVVPASTAPAKLDAIRDAGAEVVLCSPGEDIAERAARLADQADGHFMNQFARAAEVTDWRGANNIADSLFCQLGALASMPPAWVVVGAGTGGTSATIGRYIRLRPTLARTRLCVVDPEGSAFFNAYAQGDWNAAGHSSPVVEGIGRARMEPSFVPGLIDQMIAVPDVASVAAVHWLAERTGRRFGPSTGTNIVGALLLGQAMQRRGEAGAIATLACDGGERYAATVYDEGWLCTKGLDPQPWEDLPAKLSDFALPHDVG